MKNKRSIEEQVAELTEEQKNNVLKIYKVSTIALLAITTLVMILTAVLVFLMLDIKKTYLFADRLLLGYFICIVITAVLIVGMLVFIKIKFPYYSDRKYKYMKKNH